MHELDYQPIIDLGRRIPKWTLIVPLFFGQGQHNNHYVIFIGCLMNLLVPRGIASIKQPLPCLWKEPSLGVESQLKY